MCPHSHEPLGKFGKHLGGISSDRKFRAEDVVAIVDTHTGILSLLQSEAGADEVPINRDERGYHSYEDRK